MTGRAKRIYFLLKNKSKENETERAMILKTAEEILTLKQWLGFRMKINGERNKEIAKKCGVSEATISEHWVTGLEKVSESCKYMLPVLRLSAEKSEGGRFLYEEWNAL
jgi:DNA-binding NarL/FixJ family response regulator